MTPQERLSQSLSQLGLSIDEAQQASLLKFLDVLLRENEKINLTAIKTIEDGVTKHLVDSLASLTLPELQGEQALQALDLGSGSGMPGLALAIAKPNWTSVLVESTKKKAHFLDMAAAELGLMKRVRVEAERAEVLGQGKLREKADLITCRAVGRLNIILEFSLPMLKPGGYLVAYKGPKADEELAEAAKALKVLGGKLKTQKVFSLPFTEEARTLILIEKSGQTPKAYPRMTGFPAKEPLV